MPYNQAKNPVKYMKSALKMEKEMKKMGGPLQYGSPMDMDHEGSPAKIEHEGSPAKKSKKAMKRKAERIAKRTGGDPQDEYYKLMSKKMDKKN